jgi:hypothetical protein
MPGTNVKKKERKKKKKKQFGVVKFVLNFQNSVLFFIVMWVYCGAVYLLFMDFKKGGIQVLYSVRIEFSTLMKLVTIIKMCLNSEWPETTRVSVVMLFNFALECAIKKK